MHICHKLNIVKIYSIFKLNCRPHDTFYSHKAFLKSKKMAGTSLSAFFFHNFQRKMFFIYILLHGQISLSGSLALLCEIVGNMCILIVSQVEMLRFFFYTGVIPHQMVQSFWDLDMTNFRIWKKVVTVKRLNSGHLRVSKNLSVIERCPLLGGNLKKIVPFAWLSRSKEKKCVTMNFSQKTHLV